jgi:hypothetical protein
VTSNSSTTSAALATSSGGTVKLYWK